MTKVNSFKAGTATVGGGDNVANGYRNKMFRAVGLLSEFRRHGLTQQDIENFSAAQQEYE